MACLLGEGGLGGGEMTCKCGWGGMNTRVVLSEREEE